VGSGRAAHRRHHRARRATPERTAPRGARRRPKAQTPCRGTLAAPLA
jgi:hypothetical protein